jgi:hypothetical protein
MEIRECLSVYLESGYLFDDMSGRLKWFEIDKILIRFTGETSKMSWAALPVEPACMGKAVGEAGRPPMFVGLAE